MACGLLDPHHEPNLATDKRILIRQIVKWHTESSPRLKLDIDLDAVLSSLLLRHSIYGDLKRCLTSF